MAIGTPSELKALAPLAGTIVVGFRGVKWQALQPELGKVALSGEIRASPRVGFARERQATAKRRIVTRVAGNSSSTQVANVATDRSTKDDWMMSSGQLLRPTQRGDRPYEQGLDYCPA